MLNSGAYDQNNLRLNLDHELRDDFKFSISAYHNRSNRQNLYGDTFFDLINQAPDVDLLTPDPDGTPYLFQGDPEGREENPLYVLATEDSRRHRARTQGSVEGRYTPYSWLTVDANVSYDRSDRRNNFFLDQGVKTEGFPLGGIGNISQSSGTTTALNAAASANALQQFGDFTLRSTFRWLIERDWPDVGHRKLVCSSARTTRPPPPRARTSRSRACAASTMRAPVSSRRSSRRSNRPASS